MTWFSIDESSFKVWIIFEINPSSSTSLFIHDLAIINNIRIVDEKSVFSLFIGFWSLGFVILIKLSLFKIFFHFLRNLGKLRFIEGLTSQKPRTMDDIVQLIDRITAMNIITHLFNLYLFIRISYQIFNALYNL